MSQLKLTADSGGGTVALKGPASTTGNAAIELTAPGTGNGTILTTNSSVGKILQVVQTLKTDSYSEADNNFNDITGMTASITPSSSSSKVLVKINLNFGGQDNGYYVFKLLRGTTHIGVSTAVSLSNQINGTFIGSTGNGDNSYYKMFNAYYEILDTPSTTSATTYKIQVFSHNSRHFRLNRPYNNDNYDYIQGGTSTITLMEVAA